ncbi:MAG: FliH/SctL family protein [Panacagrimonas sp.]
MDLATSMQRWQMPSLRDTPAEQPPPTARHLEELEAVARREGFAQGHADGYAAGFGEVQAQAQRMRGLIEQLAHPIKAVDAEVERALVELAIVLAGRLASQSLALVPERVAALVREAVEALGIAPRLVRIFLHPDDVALLRPQLEMPPDIHDWRLLADAQLARGDCRVSTDSMRVDASLAAREQQLRRALMGVET